MRAARLLQILLLLQNRGRMTSAELASEVEVTRRTILRDVDAMTEAGLPIVVHRGNTGGIELGFNYRTRLTGLTSSEAEALAVILSYPIPELADLAIEQSAISARRKLLESFPDGVREKIFQTRATILFETKRQSTRDPRIEALALAIRGARYVRINARSKSPRTICPVGLLHRPDGWHIIDQKDEAQPIALNQCGDINISARTFASQKE